MADQEPTPQLRTLARSLDVLEIIESSAEPISLSELAKKMGESTPIIFRVLQTLELRGYIRRRPEDKRYYHTGRSTGSGAVRRAVMLLKGAATFSFHGGTIEELAQKAAIETASVEDLLAPLMDENIIEETAEGRWRLAGGLMEIVQPFLNSDDLTGSVWPLMEKLHSRTDETVSLFRRSGDTQFVAAAIPSTKPIRFMLEVGNSFPLYLGAAGKAELAMMSEADQDRHLDAIMADSGAAKTPDIGRIRKDLVDVRKRGFAISYGERVEGACSVAVPIRDQANQIRGVLGLMMPAFRVERDRLEAMGEMLRAEVESLNLPPRWTAGATQSSPATA